MPIDETDKRKRPDGEMARLKRLELFEEEPDHVLRQRGRDPYNAPAHQPRRWSPRDGDEEAIYFVAVPVDDDDGDGND